MNAIVAAVFTFTILLFSAAVWIGFRRHRKAVEALKKRNPDVIIVREYGQHKASGLWFYEDGSCRFGPLACQVVERQFNGMFLFKGKVYVLSKKSANARAAKVRESLGVQPRMDTNGHEWKGTADKCPHPSVHYNPEHDNFYCELCHKGQGQQYYAEHIAAEHSRIPALRGVDVTAPPYNKKAVADKGASLPDTRGGTITSGDNGPAPDRADPLPPAAPPAAKS